TYTTYLHLSFLLSRSRPPPCSTLFPYTTLFRSLGQVEPGRLAVGGDVGIEALAKLGVVANGVGINHEPVERSAADRVGRRSLDRSEEHTSELQSRENLVCRLLLEKKKKKQ